MPAPCVLGTGSTLPPSPSVTSRRAVPTTAGTSRPLSEPVRRQIVGQKREMHLAAFRYLLDEVRPLLFLFTAPRTSAEPPVFLPPLPVHAACRIALVLSLPPPASPILMRWVLRILAAAHAPSQRCPRPNLGPV